MLDKKYFFELVLLVGLFVCGINLAQANTDKIYVVGDSMSAVGWTLADLMKADNSWEVVNNGVGGTCTDVIVGQLQGAVAAGDASYAVIWGGTNDVLKYNNPVSANSATFCAYANGRMITASNIEQNLQAMYDAAHNAGIKVVAIGLTPIKGNVYYPWTQDMQNIQDQVDAWMSTARNVDYFIPVYSQLEDPQNLHQLNPAYEYIVPSTNLPDHLHLNDAGNTLVANLIKNDVTWTHSNLNTVTCATSTCVGVSCYDNLIKDWIKGSKTEGCATGSATATPTTITPPNSTQITWTSSNAESMEAQCTGPVTIPRGGWFINNQTCKDSNLVKECTNLGYQFSFTSTQTGQETCTFYPTNTDNQPGTPYSVIINVNKTPTNSDCSAAGYVTIHDPYTRAPEDKTTYAFGITANYFSGGYLPYMRMFIPPGAIISDLLIQEGGKQMAMSRFGTPPTTPLPASYNYISQPATLTQLELEDGLSTETLQGDLYIMHDSSNPPRSISNGGWLYVHIGGGAYSQTYYNKFTVQVDTKTYNNWYDHSGSNPDGSINWAKDVEGVCNYTASSIAAPQKDSSPSYTCQPDNSSCAKNTCKDVSCFDGCNNLQGTKDCQALK